MDAECQDEGVLKGERQQVEIDKNEAKIIAGGNWYRLEIAKDEPLWADVHIEDSTLAKLFGASSVDTDAGGDVVGPPAGWRVERDDNRELPLCHTGELAAEDPIIPVDIDALAPILELNAAADLVAAGVQQSCDQPPQVRMPLQQAAQVWHQTPRIVAGRVTHGHRVEQHFLLGETQRRSLVSPVHLARALDHSSRAGVGIDPRVVAVLAVLSTTVLGGPRMGLAFFLFGLA